MTAMAENKGKKRKETRKEGRSEKERKDVRERGWRDRRREGGGGGVEGKCTWENDTE